MSAPSFYSKDSFYFHMKYWRPCGAVLSGLLLSAAFPPLEWDLLIWLAFLPLLLLPAPVSWGQRLLTGYIWGYVHSASSLLWLNEVGFAAGFLLSFYCALYPMIWYALFCHLLCLHQLQDSRPDHHPPALYNYSTLGMPCLLAIVAAVFWVSLEWFRSWFLTGFPWNQLGISLYRRIGLIQISSWTGVSGLSFLIVAVNFIMAAELIQLYRIITRRPHSLMPWHLIMGAVLFLPVVYTGSRKLPQLPPDTPILRATAVQGNIPQCRFWTEEEYFLARDVYSDLSRKDFQNAPRPDLFIWPECAVPASLDYPPYHWHLNRLLKEIPVPFLIGATQNRTTPDNPKDFRVFNSVFLLKDKVSMDQYYDKMHRVPFGEFVPGSRYFPILQKWLGMGRDLTPGRSPTLFRLPKGALAGVNICFEDIFPEISRTFTLRGANLLMTLTNDAWYNESAGSRQHLSHVVFRAVENRRPLLRSGNNSDTCLITPDGRIRGIPRDPDTKSRFHQCASRYQIPVCSSWGSTFYTRHGNIFAFSCNILTALMLIALIHQGLLRKKILHDAVLRHSKTSDSPLS